MDNRSRATDIEHGGVERRITALAARQCGYFSRAQLLDAGVGEEGIRYRVRVGRYVKVHRGVYGVAPVCSDLPGLAWAAVLACGVGAVASHLTAAVLWAFIRHHLLPLHVTAPSMRNRPGVVTNRSRALARQDITRQRSVPVTSRARTLLDIAPLLDARRVRRVVNDEAREGRLRLALDTIVNGVEVDAYYPEHDLIIELDTQDYHGDPRQFEVDRERDAVHLAHGTPTLRITGERLDQRPAQEASRLSSILKSRGAQ